MTCSVCLSVLGYHEQSQRKKYITYTENMHRPESVFVDECTIKFAIFLAFRYIIAVEPASTLPSKLLLLDGQRAASLYTMYRCCRSFVLLLTIFAL